MMTSANLTWLQVLHFRFESADPFAPRQGWNPTLGCTRAQNEDVDELCKRSEDFLNDNPGRSIDYIRNGEMANGGITNATRQ